MIDEEYSEIEKMENWQLFRKKFTKHFLRKVKIRRFWQEPNEAGFKKYHYKDFEDAEGENKYIICLVPSRSNLSTKTGISEIEKTEGLKEITTNYIAITDFILLNNKGEKGYTDLILIEGKWCRPLIMQKYNIIIPHFEYQLEDYTTNIEFVKD